MAERSRKEPEIEKFADVENFGERLQNINEPVLILFDLLNLKPELLNIKYYNETETETETEKGIIKYPAQPAFIDTGSVVFMGIDVGSRKLGMSYIYCRSTSIYRLNLQQSIASKHKTYVL